VPNGDDDEEEEEEEEKKRKKALILEYLDFFGLTKSNNIVRVFICNVIHVCTNLGV
jgi:hypothetical protein